ncbi:hypothetical protein Slala02_70270 [Streptomyces lavendulae subsp. lavendulae]|nr:hypothetical protein Slala01_26870 [Streptomyces lavendulae subsp. lavendulae]GLX31208.1 hypothetical protein Slala02_70270 [Streptomyces lavendulae subsp. lavendulae]
MHGCVRNCERQQRLTRTSPGRSSDAEIRGARSDLTRPSAPWAALINLWCGYQPKTVAGR